MEYRVNPELAADLTRFQEAGVNLNKCFNCGTCTAVCAHAEGGQAFPRKIIRYAQLGLDARLQESPEPWLCYYCGNCSETCPREANPAELMMAARRWLTSRYDWTGLSRRLYLSTAWEVGLLAVVSFAVLAFFLVPGWFGVPFGFSNIGSEGAAHVRLDLFAPKEVIHYADWVLAAGLGLLLGINALRMIVFVRRGQRSVRIPFKAWFTQLPQLFIHGATQRRWLDCRTKVRNRWLLHLMLVTGYATMFLLVVLFLPAFQRDGAEFHYSAIFGYYATFALLAATVLFARDRIRKEAEIAKFSHVTDWMFLALLFLTALSGIVLHVARLLDLPSTTYVLYVVHLMIAVPMLVIEVPFGKWLHLVFRPVSEYLVAVGRTAEGIAVSAEARTLPAAAR
ncbi:MAG: 4Fe-4S dicluster domain-containing protein, partial [Acidobacteria bacterium]